MTPDAQWTQAETVRTIQRIEAGMLEIRDELRLQRRELVSRELWEEWKGQVATDIVNLEAEQARIRKDTRDELAEMRNAQRWAVGFALTAVIGVVGTIINALGLGSA